MKLRTNKTAAMLVLAGAMLWQSGCGGSGANVVVDTVSPTSDGGHRRDHPGVYLNGDGFDEPDSTWTCTYRLHARAHDGDIPTRQQTRRQNCTSGQTVNGGSIGTWTSTRLPRTTH